MEEPLIEEMTTNCCGDCGEEFNYLFTIRQAEGKEVDPENEHVLGSRCRDCMVAKFPQFQEEIEAYSELLEAYMSLREKYMSESEWESLYGKIHG